MLIELIVFLLLVERSFPRRLSLENELAGVAAWVRRWRDKNGTRESRGARRLLSLSRLADAAHGVATPLERRSNNSRFEEQHRWSSSSSSGSPLLVTREKGWGKEERSEVGAGKSFAITHNGSRRVWRIVNRLTLSQLSFLANERAGQSEREGGEIKRLRKRKNELQWAGERNGEEKVRERDELGKRERRRTRKEDRLGQGCSSTMIWNVHEFHAQCPIDMAVSHKPDTARDPRYRPLSSSTSSSSLSFFSSLSSWSTSISPS